MIKSSHGSEIQEPSLLCEMLLQVRDNFNHLCEKLSIAFARRQFTLVPKREGDPEASWIGVGDCAFFKCPL
jgi:hypothetical protein